MVSCLQTSEVLGCILLLNIKVIVFPILVENYFKVLDDYTFGLMHLNR